MGRPAGKAIADPAIQEAALWKPAASMPKNEIVLIYVPASAIGEPQGWIGQANPGEWIRDHATHWRQMPHRPCL